VRWKEKKGEKSSQLCAMQDTRENETCEKDMKEANQCHRCQALFLHLLQTSTSGAKPTCFEFFSS
jgi:hypothetical protein